MHMWITLPGGRRAGSRKKYSLLLKKHHYTWNERPVFEEGDLQEIWNLLKLESETSWWSTFSAGPCCSLHQASCPAWIRMCFVTDPPCSELQRNHCTI